MIIELEKKLNKNTNLLETKQKKIEELNNELNDNNKLMKELENKLDGSKKETWKADMDGELDIDNRDIKVAIDDVLAEDVF